MRAFDDSILALALRHPHRSILVNAVIVELGAEERPSTLFFALSSSVSS